MRRFAATVVVAAALAACGTAEGTEVTGIVVEFEGDITSVRRFVVKDAGGRDFVFVAAGDLVFHGAPAGHVGEHQRTGVPVTVRYTVTDGGVLVAEEVFDAGQ